MDLETKKLVARLEALETALVVVARHNPGVHQALRVALAMRYEDAVGQANAIEQGGFQSTMRADMRPTRDTDAEQAEVEAYDHLRSKLERSY